MNLKGNLIWIILDWLTCFIILLTKGIKEIITLHGKVIKFIKYMLPIRYWYHHRKRSDYCLSYEAYTKLMLGSDYTVWKVLTGYKFGSDS